MLVNHATGSEFRAAAVSAGAILASDAPLSALLMQSASSEQLAAAIELDATEAGENAVRAARSRGGYAPQPRDPDP